MKIEIKLLYFIPFILVFAISFPSTLAQEIQDNEIIPHKDLAISYIIGRDGSITAKVEDDSFTVTIPQIANHFWQSIEKTIVNENITFIEFINGQNELTLTLNMTDNILEFDLEGRLVEANLLSFQFSENTRRLGENRTGLRLENNREFYFDWADISLQTEFIESSKSLRVDIRSAPTFKLDPRISVANPDFETGDFTGWTTTGNGAGCTTSVNSTNPINGTWSHKLISTEVADNNCRARQIISTTDDIFIQHQFKVESNSSTDDGELKLFSAVVDGGSERGEIGIRQNDTRGGLEFIGRYRDNGGPSNFITNNSFPLLILDTIYCVEYRYDHNASPNSGNFTMWVNQTRLGSTLVDNDALASGIDGLVSGQFADESTISVTWFNDDFYADNSTRINTCPEGLIPPPPPPIIVIVVDFFPLAPMMNLFFIVGGFLLIFSAKGRLEFQAGGMFFFLASLLFVSVPIYAIIDDTSSLAYVVLNYPDGIRNNFVLINFVFIGLGLTSIIINNKGRLGFR